MAIEFTEEHNRKLTKLHVDMYEGDGMENPPVVTRLDRVERAAAKIDKMFWAMLAAAGVGILNLVFSHLKF